MVMNAATIHRATSMNAAGAAGETAKTVKAWLGRLITNGVQLTKEISTKIARILVEFFKNFAQNISTGYGVGAVGASLGGGLLITALCLNKERHAVPRAILTITSATFFFLAGAVMFAFGKNPVSFVKVGI